MKHEYLFHRKQDAIIEKQQAIDEGRDFTALEKDFEILALMEDDSPQFQESFSKLLDKSQSLPMLKGAPWNEPSDLQGIRAASHGFADFSEPLPGREILADRIHAAWLGRAAGNMLGKPVEGWPSKRIWGLLKDLGQFPLRGYFRSDMPEEIRLKYSVPENGAFIDQVPHAVEDDDLNYTVAGLAVFMKHGKNFTSEHVADFWLENIPLLHTFTAERAAYRNLTLSIPPPESGQYRNPYREWIGAQIRADFWGYAAPGNPSRAAEYAWRDAVVSHVKNGIYGEMWAAAMLSVAPVLEDASKVIQAGLHAIPQECRLAHAIREVLAWHAQGMDALQAIQRIHARWDETFMHHWCHTISNAQIVALGLLWGEGDFGQSICLAVQACFDTDCNGATVGSIFGMMHGRRSLPEEWIEPLHDTLDTGIAGYHQVKISELAEKTVQLALGEAI